MRAALPLSGRGPAFASGFWPSARTVTLFDVTRREPRKRRGSSSWMPATAAIDNETLDHLLSVVDEGNQYSVRRRICQVGSWNLWKLEPRPGTGAYRGSRSAPGATSCAIISASPTAGRAQSARGPRSPRQRRRARGGSASSRATSSAGKLLPERTFGRLVHPDRGSARQGGGHRAARRRAGRP